MSAAEHEVTQSAQAGAADAISGDTRRETRGWRRQYGGQERSDQRRYRGGERRADRPHALVSLVTRLIVAQAGVAAAIGLAYSRRHIPSIIITLMIVAALCGLAAMTRLGTHVAWISAIGLETAFVVFGLFRFATSRFLGGTLFAIITLAVLLHPSVSHAFSRLAGQARLGENAGDALEGRAAS